MTGRSGTVWCAAATPIDRDGRCDVPRLVDHLRQMLDRGCDGAVLFGTTGEGASFTVQERLAAVEAVLAAGIPADRLLLGTIDTALPDAVDAARSAIRQNLGGLVVTPPFYYKDVTSDGVTAAYRQLIEAVDDLRLRLYLYHIPQITGVGVSIRTVCDLLDSHPNCIAGFKDSASDADATAAHLAAFGERLDVYVGYEPHVPAAVAAGAAGTICGLANLVPETVRRLVDTGSTDLVAQAQALADCLQRHPLIPAVKSVLAALTGDAAWRGCRPPYQPLPDADDRTLLADLSPLLGIDGPA